MTDVLDLIPGTVENRLMIIEENQKANNLKSQLPDCPVTNPKILHYHSHLIQCRCVWSSSRRMSMSFFVLEDILFVNHVKAR